MSDTNPAARAQIEMAALITVRKYEEDQLYAAQERAMNELIAFTGRAVLFSLIYWPLWPLFRYTRLSHWSDAKRRALWDYATAMDERKERILKACKALGYPHGVIPRRGWFS